jgi:hypothetical protein
MSAPYTGTTEATFQSVPFVIALAAEVSDCNLGRTVLIAFGLHAGQQGQGLLLMCLDLLSFSVQFVSEDSGDPGEYQQEQYQADNNLADQVAGLSTPSMTARVSSSPTIVCTRTVCT